MTKCEKESLSCGHLVAGVCALAVRCIVLVLDCSAHSVHTSVGDRGSYGCRRAGCSAANVGVQYAVEEDTVGLWSYSFVDWHRCVPVRAIGDSRMGAG